MTMTVAQALTLADQDCPLPSLAGPALKVLRERVRELEAATLRQAPAQGGVDGLMQLAREWCLSWGEWAHDNDPDCGKENAAETRLRAALEAALSAQQGQGEDGMQPSRPKPRMPISPLGIEDFCFCDNTVSLQSVSGGGAPEGYLGKVQLKVNGEFVTYVREDLAQQQGQGEAVAGIQVPREGLPRVAQFIPYPAWIRLPPGIHDLFTAPPAQPAEPEGLTAEDRKWLDQIRKDLFQRLDATQRNPATANANARIEAFDKLMALAAQPAERVPEGMVLIDREFIENADAALGLSTVDGENWTEHESPRFELRMALGLPHEVPASPAPSPARGDGGEG